MLIVALVSGGDSRPKPAHPPLSRAAASRLLPKFVASFRDPATGISGQLPSGWTAASGSGVVRLRSRDGLAVVAIAALPNHGATKAVLATALAASRKTYRGVTVKRGPGSRLGGLPARSVVVFARNARNVGVRILLAAASGRRVSYLLEAFSARRAPVRTLVGAQEVVLTLRLTR